MNLVFAALLPALILMRYIYNKDKIEKEPRGLLFRIFMIGAITCIPAAIAEIVFQRGLLQAYRAIRFDKTTYVLIENIVGVALIEEWFKRLAVRRYAWKKPEFNYVFDAIVYSVFSALGFAALENILYVVENGWFNALMRAVTAVPSHAIDGVIMGYYLGEAKVAEVAGQKGRRSRNLFMSLFMPTIIHGVYDAALSLDSDLAVVGWLLFVIVVEIWAMWFVHKSSKEDAHLMDAAAEAIEEALEEKSHS